jgi:hypothetical protein
MSNLRFSSVLLALAVGVATPAVAAPQAVRGGQFISMMQGNTLSGTNASGATVNIYFLPGGVATYEDTTGTRDGGSWHIDKDGDVCVAWQNPADRQEGCFRVMVDDSKVTWEGKGGSGRGTLRGGVGALSLKATQP